MPHEVICPQPFEWKCAHAGAVPLSLEPSVTEPEVRGNVTVEAGQPQAHSPFEEAQPPIIITPVLQDSLGDTETKERTNPAWKRTRVKIL